MEFSKLNPGDKVVVRHFSGSFSRLPDVYEVATVIKAGDKKVKTDKGDFSTRRGQEWGKDYYNAARCLSEISVEDAMRSNAEREKESNRLKLAQVLKDTNWRGFPLDKLEQIAALIGLNETTPA